MVIKSNICKTCAESEMPGLFVTGTTNELRYMAVCPDCGGLGAIEDTSFFKENVAKINTLLEKHCPFKKDKNVIPTSNYLAGTFFFLRDELTVHYRQYSYLAQHGCLARLVESEEGYDILKEYQDRAIKELEALEAQKGWFDEGIPSYRKYLDGTIYYADDFFVIRHRLNTDFQLRSGAKESIKAARLFRVLIFDLQNEARYLDSAESLLAIRTAVRPIKLEELELYFGLLKSRGNQEKFKRIVKGFMADPKNRTIIRSVRKSNKYRSLKFIFNNIDSM